MFDHFFEHKKKKSFILFMFSVETSILYPIMLRHSHTIKIYVYFFNTMGFLVQSLRATIRNKHVPYRKKKKPEYEHKVKKNTPRRISFLID